MKAVRFHEYGDIGVLRYEDVERPWPGPGEVLVRVAATAFNPVDTWFRSGIIDQFFPVSFPHTLGLDVAGTVVELGSGVRAPGLGEAVIGFLDLGARGGGTAPARHQRPAPTRRDTSRPPGQ